MKLYIYHKTIENISEFNEIIDVFKEDVDDMQIVSENRRTYRILDSLIDTIEPKDTVIAVMDLSSLGLTDKEILNRLTWFIEHRVSLIIRKYTTTYEYGFHQPMNKAVLSTIKQTLLEKNKNIVEISRNKRSNSGRRKIAFPEEWDKLYEEWEQQKISSKEFMKKTNLKKGTFYNLITEYRAILKEHKEYMEQNSLYIRKKR